MYALWYPSLNPGQTEQVANSGATIGGQFSVRVVVQPSAGVILGASVVQQSIIEQTNAHPVTPGQLAEFGSAQPDPRYGDPTQNVVVLQSPFMNLAGHNGTYLIEVTVRYYTGPIPYQQFTETASMTLTMNNLVLVDSRDDPYFLWKPDEMTGVPFSAQLLHAQNGTCTVKLEIFRSDDNQNPILVKEFEQVPRPGNWSWTWDGKLTNGTIAPRGIYTYRLSAVTYVPTLPDSDSNRSGTLRITETRLEMSEDHRLFFRYYLTEAGSDGFVLAFDPTPQEVMMWDVDVTTNAGWNSLEVILPPVDGAPPGSIRYLPLIHDRGNTNGMDKAHRMRWALPLNARVPVCLVVIDPGHDKEYNKGSHGYDAGGTLHWEKDVTLTYAGTLKAQLRGLRAMPNYPGHPNEPDCTRKPVVWDTALTRTGDVPFHPDQRKQAIRRIIDEWVDNGGQARSVFLVSLHCDGNDDPEVRGVGLIYCRENPYGSLFRDYVGGWIRSEMSQQEVPVINYWECLDVKDDHLYVLRQGFLPSERRVRATLVELGFMTNSDDLRQMLDRTYRMRESRAIHYGCDSYFEFELGGNP